MVVVVVAVVVEIAAADTAYSADNAAAQKAVHIGIADTALAVVAFVADAEIEEILDIVDIAVAVEVVAVAYTADTAVAELIGSTISSAEFDYPRYTLRCSYLLQQNYLATQTPLHVPFPQQRP